MNLLFNYIGLIISVALLLAFYKADYISYLLIIIYSSALTILFAFVLMLCPPESLPLVKIPKASPPSAITKAKPWLSPSGIYSIEYILPNKLCNNLFPAKPSKAITPPPKGGGFTWGSPGINNLYKLFIPSAIISFFLLGYYYFPKVNPPSSSDHPPFGGVIAGGINNLYKLFIPGDPQGFALGIAGWGVNGEYIPGGNNPGFIHKIGELLYLNPINSLKLMLCALVLFLALLALFYILSPSAKPRE